MGTIDRQLSDIDTEDVLRLCTDEERRSVVAALVDSVENVVSLQELADEVAGGPSASASGQQLHQGKAALKHNHLPRLDETGLIEYDWRSDTVRYLPNEHVERLLEFITTELQ